MFRKQFFWSQMTSKVGMLGLIVAAFFVPIAGQGTPAQLLKEGSSYQSADDTSDRAAIAYRLVIQKYPNSIQAEQAQYFLGTYYEKKFFLIEGKSKVPDWSSFDQADKEFYSYVGKYRTKGAKSYLADSYFNLAMIALRRGYRNKDYRDTANKLLTQMNDVAKQDNKVYVTKVVWSARSDDVVKKYCDTKSLASATSTAINSGSSFDAAVRNLTTWSQSSCK
jgi:hypothetical protein